MTDDAELISLALPFRSQGRLRYFLARMEFSLEDGELVSDTDGRILCFSSADAAHRTAAVRFPEPEAMDADQQELATLRRGLEKMYGPAIPTYEFDVVSDWLRETAGPPPDPTILLEVWRLLAWAGVAPEPTRFDPMGYAGMQMNRPADEAGRARDALIETGMKLDGIVRERERLRERGEVQDPEWRDYGNMWSASDAERLAGILATGLPAFAARLTDAEESRRATID